MKFLPFERLVGHIFYAYTFVNVGVYNTSINTSKQIRCLYAIMVLVYFSIIIVYVFQ